MLLDKICVKKESKYYIKSRFFKYTDVVFISYSFMTSDYSDFRAYKFELT